jgi:hypothetical protein
LMNEGVGILVRVQRGLFGKGNDAAGNPEILVAMIWCMLLRRIRSLDPLIQ